MKFDGVEAFVWGGWVVAVVEIEERDGIVDGENAVDVRESVGIISQQEVAVR